MHRTVIPVVITAVVAASACSREPTQEIADAAAALDSARAAEAPLYAPAFWARADSLNAMLDQDIEARNYPTAREHALQVKTLADSATLEAGVGKERDRVRATELLAQVRSAIGEISAALAQVSTSGQRGQGARALRTDLAGVEQTAVTADSALAVNRYADARAAAEGAWSQVDGLKTRLAALQSPARRRS